MTLENDSMSGQQRSGSSLASTLITAGTCWNPHRLIAPFSSVAHSNLWRKITIIAHSPSARGKGNGQAMWLVWMITDGLREAMLGKWQKGWWRDDPSDEYGTGNRFVAKVVWTRFDRNQQGWSDWIRLISLLFLSQQQGSLADELVTADKEKIINTLREQEEENRRLRGYLDGLLMMIMEHNPALLELQ